LQHFKYNDENEQQNQNINNHGPHNSSQVRCAGVQAPATTKTPLRFDKRKIKKQKQKHHTSALHRMYE
jgi:hypothetical protein